MPLTHLTLDELQQHAAAKPDDPELVAEVMTRFTAGGLVSAEEAESRIELVESEIDERYAGGYQDGYDRGYADGFEEGFNKASGRIA